MPDDPAGRVVAVAAVALLAVLGGCNLGPGATPAPDGGRAPSTPAPTPGGAARSGPVGLTAGGVTDPWALREAHRRGLENRSYTYVYRLTVRRADGREGRVERVLRASADRERFRVQRTASGAVPATLGGPADLRAYVEGDLTVYRFGPGERKDAAAIVGPGVAEGTRRRVVVARAGRGLPGTLAPDRDLVYLVFGGVDTAVTGTVVRDGRTLYRVGGTARTAAVPLGRGHNVSVSALVSPAGVVYEFRAAYDVDRFGWRGRVVHRVAYRAVGETAVRRPAWAAGDTTGTAPTQTPGGPGPAGPTGR